MARKTNIKIPGLNAWVDNIKNELSENAARDIVIDLKIAGPYWSGEFEAGWVVKRGATGVSASKESRFGEFPARQPRTITDVTIPPAKGRGNITYSISNQMEYRDVALDLIPDASGKFRGDRPNRTAPKDWYVKYAQTQLRSRLEQTTGKVARLPKLRNFRGGKG
jgi:hypothetical protein